MVDDGTPEPTAPRVPHTRLLGRLDKVGLLHWEVHPAAVARSLPDGFEVDTFGGSAWVGIVSYSTTARPPWFIAVPGVSVFLETDVRTYVRGPDGESGVWLLSVDVDRLVAVALGRAVYRFPCHWSRLRLSTAGNVVVHETHRRGPRMANAGVSAAFEIGEPVPQGELPPFERFLTARSRVHVPTSQGVYSASSGYDTGSVHRARLLHCDESLLAAAGMQAPRGEPVVHYSPGAAVRVGRRTVHKLRTASAPWALKPGVAPPTAG